MSIKYPTSGFNGIETVVSSTKAPAKAPWVSWGLVGVSLLAAGATVAIIEMGTHTGGHTNG